MLDEIPLNASDFVRALCLSLVIEGIVDGLLLYAVEGYHVFLGRKLNSIERRPL